MAKKNLKQQDLVVYFPKQGKVTNEKGNVVGYFADVQFMQKPCSPITQENGTLYSNPHVFNCPIKGATGKSFMNHQIFYPIDRIKKMMKMAQPMYNVKTPDMKLDRKFDEMQYRGIVTKMQESMTSSDFVDNFNGTAIGIRADLKEKLPGAGDQLVIDPRSKIESLDVSGDDLYEENGIDSDNLLANQSRLTGVAKAAKGYVRNSEACLNDLAHMLNIAFPESDDESTMYHYTQKGMTSVAVTPNKDNPHTYDVKIHNNYSDYSPKKDVYDDFSQKGMKPDETIKTLTKAYNAGAIPLNTRAADGVFIPANASIGETFNTYPNFDSCENTRETLLDIVRTLKRSTDFTHDKIEMVDPRDNSKHNIKEITDGHNADYVKDIPLSQMPKLKDFKFNIVDSSGKAQKGLDPIDTLNSVDHDLARSSQTELQAYIEDLRDSTANSIKTQEFESRDHYIVDGVKLNESPNNDLENALSKADSLDKAQNTDKEMDM